MTEAFGPLSENAQLSINIHSISGSYWFDVEKNRTVAVHPEYIRTALQQVYNATGLASELRLTE